MIKTRFCSFHVARSWRATVGLTCNSSSGIARAHSSARSYPSVLLYSFRRWRRSLYHHPAAATVPSDTLKCSRLHTASRPSVFKKRQNEPFAETSVAHVRSLLRSTGPVPISKLSTMLGDEFLEKIGRESGGLARFLQSSPLNFCDVQLPGGVHVAMVNDMALPFRKKDDRDMGLRLIALLTVASQMLGSPVTRRFGFTSASPTIDTLAKALSSWSLVTPVQLQKFLRMYRNVFFLGPGSNEVRLRDQKRLMTLTGPSSATPPGRSLAENVKCTRLQLWLATVVPSQFHVPVSYILECATASNLTEDMFDHDTPSLENVRCAFQKLPAKFVDIRVFANSPMAVFVRLLQPEPLLLQHGVPTYIAEMVAPEMPANRYDPSILAVQLTRFLQSEAAADRVKYLRLCKGIDVADLRQFVPRDLLSSIEAFYGLAAGGETRVSILLFDRLRHLWEVSFDTGRVRPWSFLPAAAQPSSLTMETSPLPRVLLHSQRILIDKGPLSPQDLYSSLPDDLQKALVSVFDTAGHAASQEVDAAATQPTPLEDVASAVNAITAFVKTHTLFLFFQGDLISTPLLAAKEEKQKQFSKHLPSSPAQNDSAGLRGFGKSNEFGSGTTQEVISEAVYAEIMHSGIPPGQVVVIDAIRESAGKISELDPKFRPVPNRKFRREFFERQKGYFRVYELFAHDKAVIGRAEDPAPSPHLLQPRITTIEHLIKFMAILSSRSVSDGALTRSLPRSARSMLRSIGSFVHLAEQLPMWFVVQRDRNNLGSSLIRYIGPAVETRPRSPWALKPHPRGVLTRKVPNDPFADIAPDDVNAKPEEWNDDWNEEEDDNTGDLAAPDGVDKGEEIDVVEPLPAASAARPPSKDDVASSSDEVPFVSSPRERMG